MLKKATFLALSLIALGAQATLITQTAALNMQTTEIAQSFSVNQFDASLGTLNSVTVNFTGRATSSATLANSAAQSQRFQFSSTMDLNLQGTGIGSTDIILNLFNFTGNVPASSSVALGPVDVTGNAGAITNLAAFIGNGTADFTCTSLVTNSQGGGGGNVRITQTTQAGCGLEVVYDYTARQTTVPEPGSMALVGLALAGLGLSARRRAK